MDSKPKISPDHTYVFDDSDLEQFDELSLSCVMEAVQQTDVEQDRSNSDAEAPEIAQAADSSDELTLEED